MDQSKKLDDPGQILDTLRNYVESLGTDDPKVRMRKLGELVGPLIDRVRLFQLGEGSRVMVSETPFRQILPAESRQSGLAKITDVDDPDITLALTLKEDGSVSLDVSSEPALVGQDLSQITRAVDATGEIQAFNAPLGDEFISAQETAAKLRVAKTTVTRRIAADEMIGFRVFKKSMRIPREQFVDGDVVQGIKDIIALFDGDHKEAWFFLSSPIFYGDTAPRPIDRLRAARGARALAECLRELKAVKESHDYGDHF